MRPLAPNLIKQLHLESVAALELVSTRNLLPPGPDVSTVKDFAKVVTKMTESRLGHGMHIRPMTEIAARKSRHGLRPLPIMGLSERVTYAALTKYATKEIVALKRTAQDWVDFTLAPVRHGESLTPKAKANPGRIVFGNLMPWASPVEYVVKSDVTAFYRHVDHALLSDQLILRGAPYDAVDHLIEFLGELEGRAVGLPQLFDASDLLSEVYVDAVERNMLRRGYHVWRFNDDFRIACRGYMDALRAVEDLDREMRQMGLTLNESKTTTPSFSTYYLDTMGLEVADDGTVMSPQEVEDVVGDYTDDFSQDADSAAQFLDRTTASPTGDANEINLREATSADARLIRRALAGLAAHKDDRAIDKIPDLVRYLAELTPSAVRYLLALRKGGTPRSRLGKVLDELSSRTATNGWQRGWIIHAYQETGVLNLRTHQARRIDWLERGRRAWSEPLLRAQATRALASVGKISLDEVLREQSRAPESLDIYYADAARILGNPTDLKLREKTFSHDALLKRLATA